MHRPPEASSLRRLSQSTTTPILVLIAIVSVMLFGPGVRRVAADGIAVYPASIKLDNALRGSSYFRQIGVDGTNSDSDRTYHFEVDGDIARWLSFVDPQDRTTIVDSLTVPAHAQRQVFVKVSVPGDVPNGPHTGTVLVVTSVEGQTSTVHGVQSTVNLGAEIELEADVTGAQNIAGSLLDASAADTEVGFPLEISTKFQNSGNVQINPRISVDIVNEKGTVVDQKAFTDQPVYAGDITTIVSKWDTSNALPGAYTARVSVDFGGLDLGKRDLPFRVLQRGALTRQGTFEKLDLANKPEPGGVAQIVATVVNSGQIESKAVFVGELYRGSALTKSVTSVEELVPRGARANIQLNIDVPKAGEYTLRGNVNFEGKDTDVKELTFQVGTLGGGPSRWMELALAAGGTGFLALLLLGAVVGARALRARNRRPAEGESAASPSLSP